MKTSFDGQLVIVQDGCTPLHLACAGGQEDLVDILLKAGSPIEVLDKVDCASHSLHVGFKRMRVAKCCRLTIFPLDD